MIMVPFRNACVLVLLLYSAWLSTARLHSGSEINAISVLKASAVTAAAVAATDNTKMNGIGATDYGNLKNIRSRKLRFGRERDIVKSDPNVNECKTSMSKRLSDEAEAGFIAFSADYHAARHHSPKNN